MSTLTNPTSAPTQKWPIKDNTYVIKNFKFGTGETLPELKLEYITLGHRTATPPAT